MARQFQDAFIDSDDTDEDEQQSRSASQAYSHCSRTSHSRDRSRSPHMSGDSGEKELIDLTADEESSFVCDFGSCGRAFTSKRKLGYHKRVSHWAYRECTICKGRHAKPEQYRLDRILDVHEHFSQYHSKLNREQRMEYTVQCYGKERELLDGGWAEEEMEEGRNKSPQPSTSRASGGPTFRIRVRDSPAQQRIRNLEKALAASNEKNQQLNERMTEERVEMQELRAQNSLLQGRTNDQARSVKLVNEILIDITRYIHNHPGQVGYVVQRRAEVQHHLAILQGTSTSTAPCGTGREVEGTMQIVPGPTVEEYNKKEAELEEAKQRVAEFEVMEKRVAELEEGNRDVAEMQWQLEAATEDRNSVLRQLQQEEDLNRKLLEERNALQSDLDRAKERCGRRDGVIESLRAMNDRLEINNLRLNRMVRSGNLR